MTACRDGQARLRARCPLPGPAAHGRRRQRRARRAWRGFARTLCSPAQAGVQALRHSTRFWAPASAGDGKHDRSPPNREAQRRSRRITSGASSRTSSRSSRPRASAKTPSASSPPRRTSPNGCSNGGSRPSAPGWRWRRSTGPSSTSRAIDYQDAYYYAAPKAKPKLASLDELDPEIRASTKSSASRSRSRRCSPASKARARSRSTRCSTASASPPPSARS